MSTRLGTSAFLSLFIAAASGQLAGCGDNLGATQLEVRSPARGLFTPSNEIEVAGIATDGRSIGRVEINGEEVALNADGSFSSMVALEPGTNIVETLAVGFGGTRVFDRRTVVSGEMVAGPASDGVVVHYGVRGLSSVAGIIHATLQMPAVYTAIMAAPLKESGVGCTLDSVAVSTMSSPINQFFMYGIAAGLGGEILYSPMALSASASYMDSGCNPQVGTFDFETLELHWTYRLDVTFENGEVSVELVDSDTLYDHELIYTNNDIEAAVFDRVATDIHTPLDAALLRETTPQISTNTTAWFGSFSGTEALGEGDTIDRKHELIAVEAGGGIGLLMTVATTIDAAGAATHVATPATAEVPRGSDAAVAISDDSINQALGALWRQGRFDITLPSSGATLTLLTPPTLRAVIGQAPTLVFGDWIASQDGSEIALSGEVALTADDDPISLRLVSGEATVQSQLAKGNASDDAVQRVQDEAATALTLIIDVGLAAIGLPIASSAADGVIATSQDGFVEISIDLSSL